MFALKRPCEVNVCFTSKPMFRSAVKDRIPTHQISNVIYLFKCRCGRRYVGIHKTYKTMQRLEARIAQYVSVKLTRRELVNTPQSAIGEHLMTTSNTCLDEFNRDQFTIVCTARTCSVLHVTKKFERPVRCHPHCGRNKNFIDQTDDNTLKMLTARRFGDQRHHQ